MTVAKAAMALLGWAVGPARLPNLPALEAGDAERLAQVLQSWHSDAKPLAAD